MQKLSLSEADVLCIYGLPDSKFSAELVEWLEEDQNRSVIVLEDEENALLEELPHKRMRICYTDNDEALKKIAWDHVFLSFDFLERGAKEKSQALFSKMAFFVEGVRLVASDYKERGLDLLHNFLENSLHFVPAREGKALFGTFSQIPAIICGAGPSLEKEIAHLKNLKDRALIFAGGTTLSSLAQFFLRPHFAGSIDPHPPSERFFLHQAYEVPLFFQTRAHPSFLNLMQGPLLKIAGNGADFFEQETFDGGWNVTTFLTALACHLGCNPIILVGVDLSQRGEKCYAGNLRREEEGELIATENDLLTRKDWLFAADWFSEFAKKHPEVHWINASDGLSIKGMEECNLSGCSFERQEDLFGLIHSRIQTTPQGIFSDFHSETFRKSLANVAELCTKSLQLLEKIFPKPPEKNGEYALFILEVEKEMAYQHFLRPVWEVWKYVFIRQMPEEMPKAYAIDVNQWLFMKGICDDARKI